jgi:hypothetical protein
MYLMPHSDAVQQKHIITTERGAFSIFAQQSKGQVVTSLMAKMLKKAGWILLFITMSNKVKNHTTVSRLEKGKMITLYYVVTRSGEVHEEGGEVLETGDASSESNDSAMTMMTSIMMTSMRNTWMWTLIASIIQTWLQ